MRSSLRLASSSDSARVPPPSTRSNPISYWARGIPLATVERSLAHSLCFALLDGDRQVGFARVISDRATIAYLGDVFVLPEYRGRGLS